MIDTKHHLYGKPTYIFRATEDEPWDYEAFYGNLGPDFGLYHCVVEYDFAFIPASSSGAM